MQKILQDVEDEVQKVKAERARTKAACSANLAELEKLLDISTAESSEERGSTIAVAETVA